MSLIVTVCDSSIESPFVSYVIAHPRVIVTMILAKVSFLCPLYISMPQQYFCKRKLNHRYSISHRKSLSQDDKDSFLGWTLVIVIIHTIELLQAWRR